MFSRTLKIIVARVSTIQLFAASSLASQPQHHAGHSYKLIQKTRLSLDSCLLRFALPPNKTLGDDLTIPTCITVTLTAETARELKLLSHPDTDIMEDVSKSYSPISHPSAKGYFEVVVKSYPYRPGGGVGSYLCGLEVQEVSEEGRSNSNSIGGILAKLKSPRMMHGSPAVINRWKHIGLVAGGTGIAPLFQIARIALEEGTGTGSGTETETETNAGGVACESVHLLYVNRRREDILMKDEINRLAMEYPGRFFVTYSLTREGDGDGEEQDGDGDGDGDDATCSDFVYQRGRGSAEMALGALPPPSNVGAEADADADARTMILVCGKDGFVKSWAGAVGRGPDVSLPDGTSVQGKKIQGELAGWLAEAGYRASEVFKY